MITKKSKLDTLLGQRIFFISLVNSPEYAFPNSEFKNTICTMKYNGEDPEDKYFEYALECTKGNAYLTDGEDIVEYYTKEDYPEYFL